MIRINRVALTDFGPFLGHQDLYLPSDDGVVVIHGDNGKGKTTFLNALRWAFTGEVLDRASKLRNVETLINRDVRELDPMRGCSVRVEFSDEDHSYEVTRSVEVTGPTPITELLFKRDQLVLNRSEANAELTRLLPPETQQFFFFDGELLNQFEDLLRNGGTSSDKLKASIERLLGVPIVTNAAADCSQVGDDASQRRADAAKRNKETNELGDSLSQAGVLVREAKASVRTETNRIAELETELEGLDEQLGELAHQAGLSGELDAKRADLAAARTQLEADEADLSDALAEGWKALISTTVADRLRKTDARVASATGRRNLAAFAQELRTRSASDDSCPVCGSTHLDPLHRQRIEAITSEADDLAACDQELMTLRGKQQQLRSIQDPGSRTRVETAEKQARKQRVRVSDLVRKVQDLDTQLRGIDQDDLRTLIRRRDDVTAAIQMSKTSKSEAMAEVERQTATRDSLEKALERKTKGDLAPEAKTQQDLAERLARLLNESVDDYRSRLLNDVETHASRLFVQMRSESDFAGLKINDSYGLLIVDDQGRPVPERSSGYEHLVALALIGGLQACSTISGPVVMDSPFGRLDPTHKKQVIANLDKLSAQAVLLVHDGEVSPSQAAELVGGRLLIQYELVRHSSTHTEIRQRRTS